ncbi:hypothetical protein AAU61_00515 [Desulfocarbo indianensis]|nr:hypothetical protein AAU61_00515 [Desulfocarbo indianensis]
MGLEIRPASDSDAAAVMAILNSYALESFASFYDHELPLESFAGLSRAMEGYPFWVAEQDGRVKGFCLARPYHPGAPMRRTAMVTYFLDPAARGRGLGSKLLAVLEMEAGARGVDNLLAEVSSENGESLSFHLRRGFVERGRLLKAGRKNGRDFDVVLMQKHLAP